MTDKDTAGGDPVNESPAETMRRAARLLAERAAEAEQPGYGSDFPGKPWCQSWTYTAVRHVQRNLDIECGDHPDDNDDPACNRWGRYAGPHIAGMHPGVGAALAEWLNAAADAWDEGMRWDEALNVACCYLGETV